MENKKIQKIIQQALDNTTTGNWLITNEELEKARINFDDFCDKLENDDRICEYELTKNGIDILFWLDYCKNIIDEEVE